MIIHFNAEYLIDVLNETVNKNQDLTNRVYPDINRTRMDLKLFHKWFIENYLISFHNVHVVGHFRYDDFVFVYNDCIPYMRNILDKFFCNNNTSFYIKAGSLVSVLITDTTLIISVEAN